MNTKKKFMNIGGFAERSGVTVRTIRYYDIKGLLKPRNYAESGYRKYCEEDFGRLEQILALKFLGFSLKEIKKMLTKKNIPVKDILHMQREAINEKIEHLNRVLNAIEEADKAISDDNIINWDSIIYIIRMVKMENSQEWTKQFYTQEQIDELKSRNYSPEQAQADAKRWEDLISDVRSNMDKPLDSPEIQALVDRWLELLGEFTQGKPNMQNSLNNLWSNVNTAPPEFQDYYKQRKDVFEFMGKAIAAKGITKPQ